MNLKQFREEHGLKQKEMQNILEMKNISQYQELEKDIENGKVLSIKNALKLVEHFGLSLDEIYGITKEEQQAGISATTKIDISPLEDNLLTVFREIGEKLGENGQQAFIQIGESILDKLD